MTKSSIDGQRLLRPQLEQQVLARERGDVARRTLMRTPAARVASRSTRSGSCVATTHVCAARRRRRRAASSPSASSALYGSSSSSSAGSCSSTRQRPSRCCIPRENVETRSWRTSQSPKRSSSIPIRSPRSGRGRDARRASGSRAASARGRRAARGRGSRSCAASGSASSPAVGAARPASTRSSVVLPEPFGPVTSRKPPSASSTSTSGEDAPVAVALREPARGDHAR